MMTFALPKTPDKFTASEKTIIEYIASHSSEFLCMTIGQLSRVLNLSDATISRFARHVGCCDFKELKQVVVDQILKKEGPGQKLSNTLDAGQENILTDTLCQQKYHIEKTLELLEPGQFSKAVNAIKKAGRVFLFAKNGSKAPAQLLEFRLRRIGVDVRLVSAEGSELAEHLAQMTSRDLAMIFSFSKLSAQAQIILQNQKKTGYCTILFTSRYYMDPDFQPDICLHVYRGEENAYHTMSAPVAVAESLALALSAVNKKEAVRQLETIYDIKSAYLDLLSLK